MTNWITASSKIKDFIFHFLNELKAIINDDMLGLYIHGSLAMGGFNPYRSDIDMLVVTRKSMDVSIKRKIAKLLLEFSNNPFPIEISFLT